MMHYLFGACSPSGRMEHGILTRKILQPYLYPPLRPVPQLKTSHTESGNPLYTKRPTSTTFYTTHSFPVHPQSQISPLPDVPHNQHQTTIHVATTSTPGKALSIPFTLLDEALDCKPGDEVDAVPASVTVPSIPVPLPPAITRLVTVVGAPLAPVAVSVVRSKLGVVTARIELGIVVVEDGNVIVGEIVEEFIGIVEILVAGATVATVVELFE